MSNKEEFDAIVNGQFSPREMGFEANSRVDQELGKVLGRTAALGEASDTQLVEPDRTPTGEVKSPDLYTARDLVEDIVWLYAYSDRHVGLSEVYKAAEERCNGLKVTYDDIVYMVDSIISEAEAERDGRDFYDE